MEEAAYERSYGDWRARACEGGRRAVAAAVDTVKSTTTAAIACATAAIDTAVTFAAASTTDAANAQSLVMCALVCAQ